jgi:hypothetical protein
VDFDADGGDLVFGISVVSIQFSVFGFRYSVFGIPYLDSGIQYSVSFGWVGSGYW